VIRDQVNKSEWRSLSGLIGWLSVCLLAAGWGPEAHPAVRYLWGTAGLFGLVSAVGLEVAHRARTAPLQRKQRREAVKRAEKSLAKITAHKTAIEEVHSALVRIISDNRQEDETSGENRGQSRMPFHRPVRVTSVEEFENNALDSHDKGFNAAIRDLSANGVGLMHDCPIDNRRVVLTFDLSGGESISLLVDLQWDMQESDGKYVSGGKLIEVMTPADSETPVALEVG